MYHDPRDNYAAHAYMNTEFSHSPGMKRLVHDLLQFRSIYIHVHHGVLKRFFHDYMYMTTCTCTCDEDINGRLMAASFFDILWH
jgi:hypothetical protein